MKKKLMMVAVLLGALSLGACVDDNESASVRGAKAEQLRSLATLNEAKAEAELIRANAEAALQQAQAAYEQAKADSMNIYNDKAEQEYALYLEKLEAETRLEILKQQEELAQYQENQLTSKYAKELADLLEMQEDLMVLKVKVAKAEAGLGAGSATNVVTILNEKQKIAEYEAQIAVLQNEDYITLDDAELLAEIATKEQELEVAKKAFISSEAYTTLYANGQKVEDALEAFEEQQELINKVNDVYYVVTGTGTQSGLDYFMVQQNSDGSLDVNSWWRSSITDARIDEYQKLQADRQYAEKVADATAALGKETDKADATYKDESGYEHKTAYAERADAADWLKAAQDLQTKFAALAEDDVLDFEYRGITYTGFTKERGLDFAAGEVESAQDASAVAENLIAERKAQLDEATVAQKEYQDALASLDLDAYNQAVADVETASQAVEEAYEAYQEAYEPITALEAEIDVLNNLADNGSIDIDGEIAELEKSIAESQKIIAELEAGEVESAWYIEYYNAQIEGLELRIKAQQQIVEAAKEALEASINSDEDTPAEEETPAA